MDPLTHVLGGVVAGSLFQPDKVGLAISAVAAMTPDVEFVTRRIPRTAFLDYHHGIAHTIPGGLAAAVVIALAASRFVGLPWLGLLPFSLAGLGSHVLLDLLMHNNGIALFAPFSRRRFSVPLVLGLNPRTASKQCRDRKYGTCLRCQANGMRYNPFFWVLAASAAGCLLVPSLARLWALGALSILLGICLYGNTLRARAISLVTPLVPMLRRKSFPASHSMTRWLVLQEGQDRFHATLVDVASRTQIWERVIVKEAPPPPVQATERMLSVRGFKNSVMFPSWTYVHRDGIDEVTWYDLSYLFSDTVELYTLRIALCGDRVLQNEFHERW